MKKAHLFLFIICLFLCSCKHTPKEGDYYEHKGTRHRIKISQVGIGDSLYNSIKSIIDKSSEESGGEPTKIRYLQKYDHDKICVMFLNEYDLQFEIITPDFLEKDYKLVE